MLNNGLLNCCMSDGGSFNNYILNVGTLNSGLLNVGKLNRGTLNRGMLNGDGSKDLCSVRPHLNWRHLEGLCSNELCFDGLHSMGVGFKRLYFNG